MNGKRAALLANHGVAAWGVTLDEAMMVAGIVEKCRSALLHYSESWRGSAAASERYRRHARFL